MVLNAKYIFKVVAMRSYDSKDPKVLSFAAGQQFYVLGEDYENKTYFVSTNSLCPFTLSAHSGFVPKQYFYNLTNMNYITY